MRIRAIVIAMGWQVWRDRIGLLLTLLTAPVFVIMFWLAFGHSHIQYTVVVCEEPERDVGKSEHSLESVVKVLQSASSSADSWANIHCVDSPQKVQRVLLAGTANAGVVVYSQVNGNHGNRWVDIIGDATSPAFHRVAAILETYTYETSSSHAPQSTRLGVRRVPLGVSSMQTAFGAYVPGLLVFAVIMIVFSTALSVSREMERGTLGRLRLSPVTSLELLAGMSAIQFALSAISISLTVGTAIVLGFQAAGSMGLALGVLLLASLSSVGVGMLVASYVRSVQRTFLATSAIMLLLVLFSGIMFPRPSLEIGIIGEHRLDPFDLLPTSHLGAALTRILLLGAGLKDVAYELIGLSCISLCTFAAGAVLFSRSGRPSSTVWEGVL